MKIFYVKTCHFYGQSTAPKDLFLACFLFQLKDTTNERNFVDKCNTLFSLSHLAQGQAEVRITTYGGKVGRTLTGKVEGMESLKKCGNNCTCPQWRIATLLLMNMP